LSFQPPIAFYKFLASNLFKIIAEHLFYAFWRGESRAYAFRARAWGNEIGIMGLDSTPFGKENPEPTGNGMELYAFWQGESLAYAFTARALDMTSDYAFVSLKYMSVPLLTLCPPRRRWRKTQANFRMHQKRRFAKSLQHKATLMEEELRHDNAFIPDALQPAQLTPATQPPPESPNQPPPPAVKHAIRRLGIGDQQSAESSPPPALERSSSQASVQDWLPMLNHYASAPFLLNKCRRGRTLLGL
jgi:hypothetical protein